MVEDTKVLKAANFFIEVLIPAYRNSEELMDQKFDVNIEISLLLEKIKNNNFKINKAQKYLKAKEAEFQALKIDFGFRELKKMDFIIEKHLLHNK